MTRRWMTSLGLGGALGLLLGAYLLFRPAPRLAEPVAFTVERGATLAGIASALDERGLVANRWGLRLAARWMGAERDLRAGTYQLDGGLSPFAVVRTLREGVIELRPVTIPEGLMMWETAGLLEREAAIDSVEFMRLVTDADSIRGFGVEGERLEGYLYPDTYDVPEAFGAADLLPIMVERARRVLAEEYAAARESELSPAEVLVLASIIEAEARHRDEGPRIAAVYRNRLRLGWKLEADPTVLYALGERRPRLYYRDLEVDSPWNTYKVQGLPPTPICSPGRDAIRAAVNPLAGCRDLFFVAGPDGRHRFTRTLVEHERAKREVRAQRDASNRVPAP